MVNYGINTTWKFDTYKKDEWILYTGEIIEEDEISLKIRTIKDEEKVIHKDSIKDSKRCDI